MREPVCPDCGAAMRPAGADAWYCHGCLGADASSESDTEGETDDGPNRRGIAGELVETDAEVVGE